MFMEFDSTIEDAEIPLYLSRFLSLPRTESARVFFSSKDDEHLRGMTEFLYPLLYFFPFKLFLEFSEEKKCCLVMKVF